jgi:cytochrome c553
LINARPLLLTFICSIVLLALHPVAGAMDMSERVKPCEACHGNQGRAGPDGYYPRLAGKPAGYLYNQMENFSQGRRRYTMMRRMMEPLSPAYQREMANHFANLQVPYLPPIVKSTASSSMQMTRGQQLALQGDPALKIPACNSCHGDSLMGNAANVPGLLGMPSAYLGAQLSAWSLGDRSTVAPDCMGEIAKRLSADDAAAVTGWLAAQAVPQKINANPPKRTATDVRCGSAPELHGALQ